MSVARYTAMKTVFCGLVFFLFIDTGELKAQTPVLIDDPGFQEAARVAIDSLYNRNPDAIGRLMKPWSEDYPEHPVWLLWDAMEYWWLVLNDIYDDRHDEVLFKKMEEASTAAGKLLKRSPGHADAHIVQAVANGYIARHNANRERWLRSVRIARTAYRAHMELEESAPDLADNMLAKGLKKYYAAYLPEAYAIIKAVSWLLPDGDKPEGLKLLEIASREAVFARPEATYFLGLILLNYENEYDKAMFHFRTLVESYPNNGYYRRLLVRSLFQLNRNQAAMQEIEIAFRYWAENEFEDEQVLKEELLYWKGRILLRTGKNEEAYAAFDESYRTGYELPNRNNRSFHALSGYYAGLVAERNGDNSIARNYYRAVTQLECEPETRKNARNRMNEM